MISLDFGSTTVALTVVEPTSIPIITGSRRMGTKNRLTCQVSQDWDGAEGRTDGSDKILDCRGDGSGCTLGWPVTENTNKIRVMLAEDHRTLREGLRMLLEVEGDIEIVAEAESGKEV